MPRVVEVPVGPQHPAVHEPIALKVYVEGEMVVKAEAVTGFNHRGIEKLAESTTFMKALYIVTRVCGICNTVHSVCYVQGVEKILGVEPPERALALRTLALELERIHSHMLAVAVLSEIMGFEALFMMIMRDREYVMHMKELLTGNRVISDFVWPGGVRRDLTSEAREKMLKLIPRLRERLEYYLKLFQEDYMVARRLENIGVISYAEAVSHALVGPVARASGVDMDVRKDEPYAWYDKVDFEVVIDKAGDAYARTLVRIKEALESLRIVEQVLEKLPSGPISVLKVPPRRLKPGEVVSRAEAPRGELVYHLVSRGGMNLYRVRIRTPSMPNILNTLWVYEGYQLADVPVILGSFDPCIACMERVVVVDVRKGVTKLVSLRKLARRWKP